MSGSQDKILLHPTNTWAALSRALVLCLALSCVSCRAFAPIHVWRPAQIEIPEQAHIALAPIAGGGEIARNLEQAMLAQRPLAKSDVALFTPEQLASRSPVRLASTAALSSDLAAIQAARAVNADIVLHGEVLSLKLNPDADQSAEEPAASQNMNEVFFSRLGKPKNLGPEEEENLILSWRVVDAKSSRTLGSHICSLSTQQATKDYPDLAVTFSQNPRQLLLAAAARESWKSIAPVVVKEEVRLAVPYFQPGAWQVRRGVSAAKKGNWILAESRWKQVVERFGFQAAAHHNLAVAYAAKEDFRAAKQQLQEATGPLSLRLPGETLFWLDKNHREYHSAHGIPTPIEGWAFPTPDESLSLTAAPPRPLSELPLWSALPFAKPPEWSWQQWLLQPVTF